MSSVPNNGLAAGAALLTVSRRQHYQQLERTYSADLCSNTHNNTHVVSPPVLDANNELSLKTMLKNRHLHKTTVASLAQKEAGAEAEVVDGEDHEEDGEIKRMRKSVIQNLPKRLLMQTNNTMTLQRSISADLVSQTRPRRDSRLFNRRHSLHDIDPRQLVEAKRLNGFWVDGSKWNPLSGLKFRDCDDEKAFCRIYREKGRKILRVWSGVVVFVSLLAFAALFCRWSTLGFRERSAWITFSILQLIINSCYLVIVNSDLWSQMRIQLITGGMLCVNSLALCTYSAITDTFPDAAISLILIAYASVRLRVTYALFVGFFTALCFDTLYIILGQPTWFEMLCLNLQFLFTNLIGACTGYFLERRERLHFFDLYTYYEDCSLVEFEKEKIDFLLHAAIPAKFIDKLPHNNPADKFPSVSVAFICLDNVIEYTDSRNSSESIKVLNELFRICEARAQQYHCEKIKTMQDKFMVVCGAPEEEKEHATILADMILAVQQDFKEMQESLDFQHKYPGLKLNLRVGMSSGPIVAGVIGIKRFCWDIWGDTVNVASRMEDPKNGNSKQNWTIRISPSTQHLLAKTHICEEGPIIYVKGKGDMQTYLLKGRKIKSRLHERRPSEPRENQLPEYRAFSWDNVEDMPKTCESETTVFSEFDRVKFKQQHFEKVLPGIRLIMIVVITLHILFGFRYVVLRFNVLKEVFMTRYAFVVPIWVLNICLSYTKFYTINISAILNSLCLLAVVAGTLSSQILLTKAMGIDQQLVLFDSTLASLSWISFLSYPFFSVSVLHNHVLGTLLFAVLAGAFLWTLMGMVTGLYGIAYFVIHFVICTLIANFWVAYELNSITVKSWQLECKIDERRQELNQKKQAVDQILKNIIPAPYIEYVSLQHDVNVDVRGMHKTHSNVAVLSSDVSSFTSIAEKMDPIVLVTSLHDLFSRFDALIERYSLEKVKTVGDGYVACSGLFSGTTGDPSCSLPVLDAVKIRNAVEMALDMHEQVAAFNSAHPNLTPIAIRIGLHVGLVFSGIVGHSKFQFDVFGHTVSVTDQLERNGKVNELHISEEVMMQLDPLWLKKNLRVAEGSGYTFRNLSGKSYLLCRKRWLDSDGNLSKIGSAISEDKAGSQAVVSTLSVLSQFVGNSSKSKKRSKARIKHHQ